MFDSLLAPSSEASLVSDASRARSAVAPTRVRPPTDPTERAIRAALDGGQRQRALDLIAREYGQAIRRTATRLLRCAATAEDVAQDALLRIMESLDRLRADTRVRSWVMTVVTHCAIDEGRRRQRRLRRYADGAALPEPAAREGSPYERLATGQAYGALIARVTALPPRVRDDVVLHFGHQQLTCEEIAARRGETGDAVQVRVRRARLRLRSELRRRDVHPALPAAASRPRRGEALHSSLKSPGMTSIEPRDPQSRPARSPWASP